MPLPAKLAREIFSYPTPSGTEEFFPADLTIPPQLFTTPTTQALAALGEAQMLCALLNERTQAIYAQVLPLGLSKSLLAEVARYHAGPLRISKDRMGASGFVYDKGFCDRPHLVLRFGLRPELWDDSNFSPIVDSNWQDIIIHELFDLDVEFETAPENGDKILWRPSEIDGALETLADLNERTISCMYLQADTCPVMIERVLAWREPGRGHQS